MVTKQSVLWMMQHHNLYLGGIIMVCVGIDVEKNKHDCFILSLEGEVLADVFTITNNREGFEFLLQRIQSCVQPTDKVKVGLEATGHYSYNILGFFLTKVWPPTSFSFCTPICIERVYLFVKPRPIVSMHERLQLCSCLMWTSSPTQIQHTIMRR